MKPWLLPTFVDRYWQASKEPQSVYVLRAGPSSIQPRGYPLGWSVSKRQVKAWAEKRGDGPNYIQRISPHDLGAVWTPSDEVEGALAS